MAMAIILVIQGGSVVSTIDVKNQMTVSGTDLIITFVKMISFETKGMLRRIISIPIQDAIPKALVLGIIFMAPVAVLPMFCLHRDDIIIEIWALRDDSTEVPVAEKD
jgi:hypothetical protein